MTTEEITSMYDMSNLTAIVTGGGGVLCGELAIALAACGARVAVLDRDLGLAEKTANKITARGGQATAVQSDVLNVEGLEKSRDQILQEFGRIDILINGAGGNNPKATTNPTRPFFDIPADALRFVFDLNILGTILPSQVFGKSMADRKKGNILNISSMNAFRPLTRIAAYSAAKAGVNNFTQWLAVHMAQEYSPDIRVNAIAPGFFLTEQNRFLLTDQATGNLTPRGESIIRHTPMARFGKPEDLVGTVLWLVSPASGFVTGTVIPVDGGFSAFSGV
jgi:NAD(P)-dependent dehydrogenase (short-subunit alcohol dehydrogenase family)